MTNKNDPFSFHLPDSPDETRTENQNIQSEASEHSESLENIRLQLEAIYGTGTNDIHPPTTSEEHSDAGTAFRQTTQMQSSEAMPKFNFPAHTPQTPTENSKTKYNESVTQKTFIRNKSIIRAVIVTALIFIIYNAPLITGQLYYYITPGNAEATPIILDSNTADVSPEPKLIISKLNIDVPVVYDETSYDEARIQAALERGIVHYGNTAAPGQLGNSVLLGHSSNSPWAPGKYKTAFSILRRLEVGDTFVVHYNSKRYIYEVFDKKVIDPSDFSVVNQRVNEPIVTLITCDPPGSNWRRLAIQAKQISPDPTKSQPPATDNSKQQAADGALPGSPPSAWDRFTNWLF